MVMSSDSYGCQGSIGKSMLMLVTVGKVRSGWQGQVRLADVGYSWQGEVGKVRSGWQGQVTLARSGQVG